MTKAWLIPMVMMMATPQAAGVSEILQAKYAGKEDVVQALLKTGVELNVFDAAATGQTARLRTIIASDPATVNTYAADGFFPLGLAVFFGNKDAAEVLLAAGADVNMPSRESMKVRPLHSAVAARRLDIVEMLLARGADPSLTAMNSLVPLHEAAIGGQTAIAAVLLKHGADVNAKDVNGKTALAYAVDGKKDETVVLLKNAGGR